MRSTHRGGKEYGVTPEGVVGNFRLESDPGFSIVIPVREENSGPSVRGSSSS